MFGGRLRFVAKAFEPDVANVELEQEGSDVNILVNGRVVAYFEGEGNDFFVNTSLLRKMNIQAFNKEGVRLR